MEAYPLYQADTYHQQQALVDSLFEGLALEKERSRKRDYNFDLKNIPVYQAILKEKAPALKDLAMAFAYRIVWMDYMGKYDYQYMEFLNNLVRKRLPFTESEMVFILNALTTNRIRAGLFRSLQFLKNVEVHVQKKGLSKPLQIALKAVSDAKLSKYEDKSLSKFTTRVKEMLVQHTGQGEATILPFLLDEEDSFGKHVNQEIQQLKAKKQAVWYNILRHASKASAGKPTKKFVKEGTVLLKTIDKTDFHNRLNDWLNHLLGMELTEQNQYYSYLLKANNITVIKGLLWLLSLEMNTDLYALIEKLILKSYKKIPGIGPTSAAVGNACIFALAGQNSLESVSLLNTLRPKIRQRNTKALIDKYVLQISEALNISVNDLADFSIPTFDLVKGEKAVAFNDYIGNLSIQKGKVRIQWIKPDGNIQKSVPAFVKKDFAEAFKALKADAKMVPKIISMQKNRLDRSYIHKRSFAWQHFQQYYIQHGLMYTISRHLIWVLTEGEQTANAIFYDDQWQNAKGQKLDWMTDQTQVRLWHPLDSETTEVLEWRAFLQKNLIQQIFKQAYREVYILTEAELNTRSYSNRMAAHILKQHQFNALASLREWKYSLIGAYDDGKDGEVASLQLPDYQMRVEYWINEINADDAWNDTGIWNYVATDQVRFVQGENVLNLVDVPKIPFSEALRDVDLFVGVASVGNDPAWQDNGGLPQFNAYWESYSFGNLSEVAKTRKHVLEKLLPRLKIAKIAHIDGKFLVVEGKIRTYKIHIGSTNILMEPNDQYLCIVPDRGQKETTGNLFIPFEGDRGLSIVLSKAFLLADDDKITDETITRQLVL